MYAKRNLLVFTSTNRSSFKVNRESAIPQHVGNISSAFDFEAGKLQVKRQEKTALQSATTSFKHHSTAQFPQKTQMEKWFPRNGPLLNGNLCQLKDHTIYTIVIPLPHYKHNSAPVS
eukprot:TRINITY_DN8631_c0_g1_i3.p1 TRINITY_DN8631_c0_g1~~TRINITY_DN8631_c0_g1_i3.p1  ORF type:complete len:117 (+),score=14.17 TRINITY_DN8631_c0_g1_i3:214-564(+)